MIKYWCDLCGVEIVSTPKIVKAYLEPICKLNGEDNWPTYGEAEYFVDLVCHPGCANKFRERVEKLLERSVDESIQIKENP